jgi:hypothetical protein
LLSFGSPSIANFTLPTPLPLLLARVSDILAVEPCNLPDRAIPDPVMHSYTPSSYRKVVKGFAAVCLLGLIGCSETNLVRDSFVAVGAGPQDAETPEFVVESRPAEMDYVPVGSTAPERPSTARTPEEVKAAEAEMEAIRLRNERAAKAALQAGRTPPPAPVKAKPATSATQ